MRLTILNQFYVPDISPTAHLAASLAEHRASRGDRVEVVTGRGGYLGGRTPPARSGDNPRIHRLWTPGLGKATAVARVLDYAGFFVLAVTRLLTLPRQDVIVSMTTPPYVVLAALAHKLLHPRTRVILWTMDCYPDVVERAGLLRPGGLPSRVMRVLNRILFRRLGAVVCLDRAMQELVRSQYAPRALPVEVIPNWEKASLFPLAAQPAPWPEAQALGLGGRFVVLYLGNMGNGHSFDTVLAAARVVRDEGVTFLFVGGGTAYPWLARRKAELGLDNVILRGYVGPKEETPSVLAAAHCTLITLRESMKGVVSPSKLHSSLAMGLSVVYVGPEGSNVDEAIRTFQCGLSVREGDTASLVAFLRSLRDDGALRDAYRARARRAFEECYSDAVTLPRFDTLIDGSA